MVVILTCHLITLYRGSGFPALRLLAEAMALAEEIAGKNPDAVRAGKALYEQAWHADARTGLELEAALQAQLIGTANQIEAVKANFEKRAPAFQPATRTEQG